MIALACDHGALDLKNAIMKHLEQRGLAYKDFGCYTKDSCDYPDFAGPAAQAVASGECDRGIVCCTTGIGVSITANKVPAVLDAALTARITQQIRDNTTPRHVPAKVVQVQDIPRTKSGKIVELAVRNVVHERPVKNVEALANPEALEFFRQRAELAD